MAVPEKYRHLGDFAAYYNGTKRAPVLTVFIGGNHEASNYLHELWCPAKNFANFRFYGGWVAPNIYYLGASGCVTYRGLKIAGLSGIYKKWHYHQGFHERLPYTEDTKRSIYHIRSFDTKKLHFLSSPTIMLSHDWPTNIHKHGDWRELLRRKPHFRNDMEKGELGSQPAEILLGKLRPQYWFSAHLHVKFSAFIDWGSQSQEDEGEIELQDSDEEVAIGDKGKSPKGGKSETKKENKGDGGNGCGSTRFLALDKCLPRRDFMDILDIENDETSNYSESLAYDAQWLAIVKTFHPYLSTTLRQNAFPSDEDLQK